MATSIVKQSVQISGDIRGLKAAYKEAATAQKVWARAALQKTELKLAGSETIRSLKTTLAVARSELNRFARNRDVKVAIEIGAANLQDAYLNARKRLQAVAAKNPVKVPIQAVAQRGKDALASIRRGLKPVTLRVQLADRALRDGLTKARARIEGLKKIRAVRIALAAIDGVKLPAQAALRTLGPLLRLGKAGIRLGVTLAHGGVLAGVAKIRAGLGGLARVGGAVGGAITAGFRTVTLAATAAAGAVIEFARAGFNSIDATTTLSQQLGITTESLSALQHAANMASVSEDALSGGLSKMMVNLQKAKDGSDEAGKAFAGIGLNVNELTALQPDQAFAKIADSIASIQDPYKRAQAAQQIFGKSAKELTPLLLGGSDALQQAAADVKVFGNEVTAIESAKIAEADKAFKEARAAVTSLAQSIAVELAPYLTSIVKGITEFMTEGDGLRSKIAPALDLVITGVGYLADAWYVVKAGVNAVQGVIAKMISLAVQGISGLISGINGAIDGFNSLAEFSGLDWKIGKIDTTELDAVAKAFDDTAKDFFDSAGDNFDKGMGNDGSQALDDWRNEVKAASDAAAALKVDQAAGLQEAARAALALGDETETGLDTTEVDKFSAAMAEVQAEIDSINQSPIDIKINALGPDVIQSQVDEYRRALESLDLQKLGANLREQLVTPMDEAQRQFEDIQRAAAAGVITSDEQKQLLANLKEQFDTAKAEFAGPSDNFGVAATVGSVESNRLDAMFRNQQARSEGGKDKSEKQLKEAEKQSRLLGSIDSALANGLVNVNEVNI